MIYLDHNSTTAPSLKVCEAVQRGMRQLWGNPSSVHLSGQQARGALARAREDVARILDAGSEDVIFTSGGTEAASQMLLGGDALYKPRHLITTAIEHSSVLDAADELERAGWMVTRLPVDAQGRVDAGDVKAALRADTALISVMLANNDSGVIQPVAEISAVAQAAGVPMHTDAVQAVGRMRVSMPELGVDYLSLSGHKFHGPKGTGALVFRGRTRPGALLRGTQEQGLRAGTENVPGMVGLGVAAQEVWQSLDSATARMRNLRDLLEAGLLDNCPGAFVHGARAERLVNTAYVAFPGVQALTLAARLDLADIAVSTSSACASGSNEPPHVLLAMGVTPELALSSLRFSVGVENTEEEIARVTEVVGALVREMRI